MLAKIYRPTKSAMQSGRANTQHWILEFEAEAPRGIDPLMGWTSSRDTRQQVRLNFDTREEAVAYARRNGIPFRVMEPSDRKPQAVSYADNFRHDRKLPWTH